LFSWDIGPNTTCIKLHSVVAKNFGRRRSLSPNGVGPKAVDQIENSHKAEEADPNQNHLYHPPFVKNLCKEIV
jgi:hypothetical protein